MLELQCRTVIEYQNPLDVIDIRYQLHYISVWKHLISQTDKFDKYLNVDAFEPKNERDFYEFFFHQLLTFCPVSDLIGPNWKDTVRKFFTKKNWTTFYQENRDILNGLSPVFTRHVTEDMVDYVIYIASDDKSLAFALLEAVPAITNIDSMMRLMDDYDPNNSEYTYDSDSDSESDNESDIDNEFTESSDSDEDCSDGECDILGVRCYNIDWVQTLKHFGLGGLVTALTAKGCRSTADVVSLLKTPGNSFCDSLGESLVTEILKRLTE